ncbi:MAG: SH3 domain-containing protein [Albidovulum sp.]|nr:SH3 domain-containing protein [Albidovulum sp.]MDE0533998.1 SH3 domain-containing protein [Albidovulum sp.]
MRRAKKKIIRAFAVLAVAASAFALEQSTAAAEDCPRSENVANSVDVAESFGPVTNLPVPRYVSMKASSGRVRVGPSRSYRVLQKFVVRGVPLRIVGEYDQWRRVQAWDGTGGWMHKSLLTGIRTVIVMVDQTPMRQLPESDSRIKAVSEKGVIGQLGKCNPDWCIVSAGDFSGWMMKSCLWGIDAEEIRD